MKSDVNNFFIEKEKIYSDEIYAKKKAYKLDCTKYENSVSVPLRQGGTNLRYRPNKALFEFLLQTESHRILDCACGTGQLSLWLAQHGKRVWAFDISQNAITLARESAERSGVSNLISFDAMDARNLSYEDNYFDIVTGKDCIHHLIKYPDAIKELARVLKPTGKAVFVEPLALNPVINILRFIDIHFHKRVGEHMLTRHDLAFLKDLFGSIRLDHFHVVSIFNKLVARKETQVTGIRRKLCSILDDIDVRLLDIIPSLSKYSSVCYIELTKT